MLLFLSICYCPKKIKKRKSGTFPKEKTIPLGSFSCQKPQPQIQHPHPVAPEFSQLFHSQLVDAKATRHPLNG